MGSLISREDKIINELVESIEQSQVPDASTDEIVLPFDPRSPTLDFNRTPIQINRQESVEEKKSPESLKLVLDIDPRSPTVEVQRTPIFVDPRSPTSKICRTPIDDVNVVDWELETSKINKDSVKTNEEVTNTGSNKKYSIYEDEEISSTPVPEHTTPDIVKPARPKKLFDESRNKPLSNVTNKKTSANTPTQILQRRHGKNAQKAMQRQSMEIINKENDLIMSQ